MDGKTKTIILKTLDIIGFTNDRENFFEEFLKGCYQKALLMLIDNLPKDRQEEITKQSESVNSPEEAQEILASYFTPEQYNEALEKISGDSYEEFIQTVEPNLTNGQREELAAYLDSIGKISPSSQP